MYCTLFDCRSLFSFGKYVKLLETKMDSSFSICWLMSLHPECRELFMQGLKVVLLLNQAIQSDEGGSPVGFSVPPVSMAIAVPVPWTIEMRKAWVNLILFLSRITSRGRPAVCGTRCVPVHDGRTKPQHVAPLCQAGLPRPRKKVKSQVRMAYLVAFHRLKKSLQ